MKNSSTNVQPSSVSLPIGKPLLSEGLAWKKFFSGGSLENYICFYKTEINGIRVEKREGLKVGKSYSIGNIDKAKKIYKTENELLKAVEKL